tara:strand:- start:227 stop:385 length:159 start_codon:yes stop_codon:yes gene_type:complete
MPYDNAGAIWTLYQQQKIGFDGIPAPVISRARRIRLPSHLSRALLDDDGPDQ